jgi:O-succinylbenzoic acid--CoA ligase
MPHLLQTHTHNPQDPQWLQEHLSFISLWNSPAATIEITTSGSTGAPKVISMPKELMRSSARLTAEYFGLGSGASVLLALPSAYIAGKMVIVRALTNNWQLWMTEPAANPLKELDRDMDFASFTPMQMQAILDENPEQLKRIAKILVGGAEIKPQLASRIAEVHGACFETYGMTETVSHVAVKKVDADSRLFEALPGVTFSTDERSCLVIRAAHLNNSEVITNDVVALTDQRHFQLLGRADDVINSGGVKLFPLSIESKLEGVVNGHYYITSIPHESRGEAVVLMIEAEHPGEEQMLLLQHQLRQLLDRYEMPAEIRFVPQFSRTESGKIKRIYL